MTITTITFQGTGLSCVANAASARRQGTSLPVSAHMIGGLGRAERQWIATDVTYTRVAKQLANPQADVDVPTVKKFRVPLSPRERRS